MSGIAFLVPLGLRLLAFGFRSLSLLIGTDPVAATKSFARDSFVNLLVTGAEEVTGEQQPVPAVEHPAAQVSLAQTARTQKSNVVLIHLEATLPPPWPLAPRGFPTKPLARRRPRRPPLA